MKVRFIKDCPWSYRLTTNGESVKNHPVGAELVVEDREADAMITAGYAEQVKPGRKPGFKPAEHKVVKPTESKPKKAVSKKKSGGNK